MAEQNVLLNSIFTVGIDGQETCVQGVSGLEKNIVATEYSTSCMPDIKSVAGHVDVSNVTISEAPFLETTGQDSIAIGNFLFEIEIKGLGITAMARSVSGMGITNQLVENKIGKKLSIQKLVNKKTYNEVTLTDVYDLDNPDLFHDWFIEAGNHIGDGGGFSEVSSTLFDEFKKDVIITVWKRNMELAVKFRLKDCIPTSYSISDLDAKGTETVTRALNIAPNGVEVLKGEGSGPLTEWVMKAFEKPELKNLVLKQFKRGKDPFSDASDASWKLFNCWPTEVNFGDLDAESDDIFLREIVVATDGWQKL